MVLGQADRNKCNRKQAVGCDEHSLEHRERAPASIRVVRGIFLMRGGLRVEVVVLEILWKGVQYIQRPRGWEEISLFWGWMKSSV